MLIDVIDCGKGLGCTVVVVVVVGVGAAQASVSARSATAIRWARNHFYHNGKYFWVPDTMASAFS